ncbi:MAG TPA: hypothetical protein VF038_17210 [Usitatibacter sp.]|jgi:hypothetical protein
MRKLRFPFLAAALCVAGAAFAQSGTTAGTQAPVGPFPPQPGDDPSLYRTLPPEAYPDSANRQGSSSPSAANPGASAQGVPGAAADAPAAPVRTPAPAVVVVVPDASAPAIPRELERAELEAEAARTPAPINGAFTGETDERFR